VSLPVRFSKTLYPFWRRPESIHPSWIAFAGKDSRKRGVGRSQGLKTAFVFYPKYDLCHCKTYEFTISYIQIRIKS
jgi:hypothetical protein